MTVEIPEKQWTLVIGWSVHEDKYTVSVNGMEMYVLPEAPMTAASKLEIIYKSSEPKM